MSRQFNSSRLKIERAYRHIEELKTVFESFLSSDFCRVSVEPQSDTGSQIIKVGSIATLPSETALIIADAVHNLRTALDHAMAEILEGHKWIQFPVGKERHNFESHSTYQTIKKTFPDLAVFLLDEVMPYDNGKPSIWAASKLDNIDKHNLLIAIINVNRLTGVSLEHENLTLENGTFTFSSGRAINFAAIPPGPVKITNKGKASAQILFGKGQPLEGQPIIESLVEMADITLQTLGALELFWFGRT
jgi:hypothetical protein